MNLVSRWVQRAWRLLQGAAEAVMAAPDLLASVVAALLPPLLRAVGYLDAFASPVEAPLSPSSRYLLRAHAQARWRATPGWSRTLNAS